MSYNLDRIKRGRVSEADLRRMIKDFQHSCELAEDGLAGDRTIAWARYLHHKERGVFHPTMVKSTHLALCSIGEGETEGNNRGPQIRYWRANDGTGRGPEESGAWCAAFGSYCLYKYRPSFRMSRGARRLVQNIGNSDIGEFIDTPEPFAAIAWKRWLKDENKYHTWQGHFGRVIDYEADTDTLLTIEGNKTKIVDIFRYESGTWRKDLDRIATLKVG